jgi:group I intron endonuclease
LKDFYTLYQITFPNGKIYIGYTSRSLEKRKRGHYQHARYKVQKRTPVMNALRKYEGKEQWKILAVFDTIDKVHAAEIATIAATNSTDPTVGYNVSLGGSGIKHTAYTKQKIGKGSIETNRRRFSKEENREKQSNALKARWAKPGAKLTAAVKRGAKKFYVIDTATRKVLGEWISQRACARQLGISPGFINNCLKKRRVGSTKYHFIYITEYTQWLAANSQ